MIILLLPAYNEEKSFPPIMDKLQKVLGDSGHDYKILVCNDGSTDKTYEMLAKYSKILPMVIIEHPINRGLGESSRDLFEKAVQIGKQGDYIIRMDCDDTHEPKYIPKIISKLELGYDVVVASRFEKGGGQMGVYGYRAFISRCANLFMKLFSRLRVFENIPVVTEAIDSQKLRRLLIFLETISFNSRVLALPALWKN